MVNDFQSSNESKTPIIHKDCSEFIESNTDNNSFYDFSKCTIPKEQSFQQNTLVRRIYGYQGLMQKRLLKEYEEERNKRLKELGDKAIIKYPYLYERMNRNYILNVKLPELRNRYRYLAERQLHFTPIRSQELKNHEQRYMEILKAKAKSKVQAQEESEMLSEEYMMKVDMKYKSKFTDEVIARDKLEKNKRMRIAANKKENYLRKATYSKIISNKCLPNIMSTKFKNVVAKKLSKNSSVTPIKKKLGLVELSPEMRQLARKYNIRVEEHSHVTPHPQKSMQITRKYKDDIMQENDTFTFKPKSRIDYSNVIKENWYHNIA